MGALFAEPLKDKAFHDRWPRIDRSPQGYTASTWWMVRTSDPYLALTASGIPAIGELFTPELPTLKCNGHSTEWMGGELTFVRATYDEGQAVQYGGPPPPEDIGVKRSEIENGNATAQVRQSITFEDILGEPATVLVGTTIVVVYSYVNYLQMQTIFGAMQAARCTLNAAPITIPPVLVNTLPLALGARTCLLETVNFRVVNQARGVIESAARLQVRKDAAAWKEYRIQYDAEGAPYTGMSYDVYEATNWGTLW